MLKSRNSQRAKSSSGSVSSGWKSSGASQSAKRQSIKSIRTFSDECSKSGPTFIDNVGISANLAYEVFTEHVIRVLRVIMFARVFHDLPDILPGIFEDEIVSTWVIRSKLGDIIYLSIADDPAVALICVFGDV